MNFLFLKKSFYYDVKVSPLFCPCVCSLPNVSSGTTVASRLLLPFVLVSLKIVFFLTNTRSWLISFWGDGKWMQRASATGQRAILPKVCLLFYKRTRNFVQSLRDYVGGKQIQHQLVFFQVHLKEHPEGKLDVRSSKPAWFITHARVQLLRLSWGVI